MNYILDYQQAVEADDIPNRFVVQRWVNHTLAAYRPRAEVTIRIVNNEEITQLNRNFRQKNKATNVLSFPVEMPACIELEYPILGDIIISADYLREEAKAENKPLEAHYAHMTIHGLLHLLGYDHVNEQDAQEMEHIEITLLSQLGYDNPYKEA